MIRPKTPQLKKKSWRPHAFRLDMRAKKKRDFSDQIWLWFFLKILLHSQELGRLSHVPADRLQALDGLLAREAHFHERGDGFLRELGRCGWWSGGRGCWGWAVRGADAATTGGGALAFGTARVEVGRFGDGAGDGACLHAAGAFDGRFLHQHFLVLGNVGFAQEPNFLVPDHERAFGQVDAGLVTLQHIESQQQIMVLAFHDCEAAREKHVSDFDLGGVDTAEDFGGANAAGDAGKTFIDQAHDVAFFRAKW